MDGHSVLRVECHITDVILRLEIVFSQMLLLLEYVLIDSFSNVLKSYSRQKI